LLFGAHVHRLFGWLEIRRCLQPVLREGNANDPLAISIGRDRERSERDRHVLFTDAEETAYPDYYRGDLTTLVEEQIIDVTDTLAGVVGHWLPDELAGEPLTCRLHGYKGLRLARLRPTSCWRKHECCDES
jgi:hypothetical protein